MFRLEFFVVAVLDGHQGPSSSPALPPAFPIQRTQPPLACVSTLASKQWTRSLVNCRYILRNPFSVAKITLESPQDTLVYRSKLNPKVHRNFEVFAPVEFLAVLSQYIPDKGAQMIRYYRLYSNKRRGCAIKADPAGADPWPRSSPPPPVKLPARKWRDLILQAWHTDPLQCPACQKQMRPIAVNDGPPVVERILKHLNLWCGPAHFAAARPPPSADPPEPEPEPDFPIDSDPLPDYENVITD